MDLILVSQVLVYFMYGALIIAQGLHVRRLRLEERSLEVSDGHGKKRRRGIV